MKIKIPAQTSKKITEEAFNRDVKANLESENNKNVFTSNNFIAVSVHTNGEKRVYQTLSIENSGKNFLSALPSPTHLYLSSAIDLYNMSEVNRKVNFLECGKKSNNTDFYLLDFEPGYTHECYTDYIKARITAIIMLVSALENFMNQIIPIDFVYEKIDKSEVKKFNHKKIEDNISFKEKLEFVIPKAINQINFWSNRTKEFTILNELYNHRKQFVHLKTKSEDEWNRYSVVFSQMLKFDILEAINILITIINAIEDNYIEIEIEIKS